jgi:hypothetical protein
MYSLEFSDLINLKDLLTKFKYPRWLKSCAILKVSFIENLEEKYFIKKLMKKTKLIKTDVKINNSKFVSN